MIIGTPSDSSLNVDLPRYRLSRSRA